MKKDKENLDEREKYLLVAEENKTEEKPEKEQTSEQESTGGEPAADDPLHEAEEKADENGEKIAKIEADVKEFHELFPRVSEKDIPSEVWERVNGGESLSASYALYFIKCIKDAKKNTSASENAAKKAPPKLKGGNSHKVFFSPDAVKAMSEAEVRKNYDAIIASMASWK